MTTTINLWQREDYGFEAAPAPNSQAGVYFIRDSVTGFIKIGSTSNLHQRMKTLQTSHAMCLELLGFFPEDVPWIRFQAEKYLHNIYREEHLGGEWFFPSEFLKSVIGDGGPADPDCCALIVYEGDRE